MRRILTSLAVLTILASAANAAPVWINEVLSNPNGSDSGAAFGNEYFELRGTPGLGLSGYYLLSLEGQGTSAGDINQFFNLSTYSIGANGYLFARQNFSPYTSTAAGATVIQNAGGAGWGLTGSSTVGHSGDSTQVDLENGATTIMLINIGGGSAPTLTDDLDVGNDGSLDLPVGWSVVDSVGIMDGAGAAASDWSYGAITLRSPNNLGVYAGGSFYGNVIDVPGVPPTSAGAFYVARQGESTGSTADDWLGAILSGVSTDPLNLTFASTSDPDFQGLKVPDMSFGGPNRIPEPGTLALLGLGGLALFLRRKR